MGRILFAGLFVGSLLTGCQLPGDKARCGFTFAIVKPPTINTESPILIQTGQPIVGAHPMGQVAGPVQEGQFLHGPAAPAVVPAPAVQTMRRMPIGLPGAPCGPSGYLTVEEWCNLQKTINEKPKSENK